MERIKTEMTSKERLTAYQKGEEVDRIPVTLTASETGPLMYGIPISKCYFSVENMVEVETRLAEDFGIDNMGMGLGLRTLPEALGCKLKYSEKNVSYIEKPAIESYAELEGRALPDITKDGRLPILVEAFERLIERFHEEKVISTGMAGPFTTAVSLVGTERFLRDSVRHPEEIGKLLRYSTDCVISCARDLHKRLGISISLSEPMASANIISKKQFRTLVLHYLSETVEEMNRFQGGTGIHICGKTKDRWDAIVESGISSFSIDNCENMKELKEAYGNEIGISGNVEPVDVLKNGTPEMIRESVIRCLAEAADNPRGFTLCPGCTTPVMTQKENLIALLNSAWIYGRHARKGRMPEGMKMIEYGGNKADEQTE